MFLVFLLLSQPSEDMYDPEIYRHQIAEYYNPYVLDADIQAGEFILNIDFVHVGQNKIATCSFWLQWRIFK